MHELKSEPRQLGTLHGRMAYLMALLARSEEPVAVPYIKTYLSNAIWDLYTLVSCLDDVAFHKETDAIVPASHRKAKLGNPRKHCPELGGKHRFVIVTDAGGRPLAIVDDDPDHESEADAT